MQSEAKDSERSSRQRQSLSGFRSSVNVTPGLGESTRCAADEPFTEAVPFVQSMILSIQDQRRHKHLLLLYNTERPL